MQASDARTQRECFVQAFSVDDRLVAVEVAQRHGDATDTVQSPATEQSGGQAHSQFAAGGRGDRGVTLQLLGGQLDVRRHAAASGPGTCRRYPCADRRSGFATSAVEQLIGFGTLNLNTKVKAIEQRP